MKKLSLLNVLQRAFGRMFLLLGLLGISFVSCNPVSDLTNVWLDIQSVEVKVDTSASEGNNDDHYKGDSDDDDKDKKSDKYGKWVSIGFTPGLYDLLKFRNGLDTVLATGTLPKGRIHKVRVTLGTNSQVSKNKGVTKLPLSICSEKPYVYIIIKNEHLDKLNTNHSKIQLDFDSVLIMETIVSNQLCILTVKNNVVKLKDKYCQVMR